MGVSPIAQDVRDIEKSGRHQDMRRAVAIASLNAGSPLRYQAAMFGRGAGTSCDPDYRPRRAGAVREVARRDI